MHDCKKMSKVKNEPKKLWKTINEIMGKESKEQNNIEFIYDRKKNRIADALEIFNAMNEYYRY